MACEHEWWEVIEETCICLQCWTVACVKCGLHSMGGGLDMKTPIYERPEYIKEHGSPFDASNP